MNLKVCVDIGSKFIKVIEGFERKGEFYITKIGKIENPLKNFRKISEESEIETFGNFLRDYFKKTEIKGKLGILNVSGEDVIYHYFEIPDLPKEEIENAVKLEAIQVISEPIENYEYDYICFPANGKKNITFIAYPTKKIKTYLDIFSKAKLKPLIMETDGTCLINGLMKLKKYENLICILNIGNSISNLAIYLKGKFLFLRDIIWGGRFIEGEEEIEEKMSNLIEELNISLTYFQNKTAEKIEKIYLTGGSAYIPEIKDILEKNLALSFENYNPLLFLKNHSIPEEIKQDGMSFSIAFGLLTRKIL